MAPDESQFTGGPQLAKADISLRYERLFVRVLHGDFSDKLSIALIQKRG